jgi:hypothetical protein
VKKRKVKPKNEVYEIHWNIIGAADLVIEHCEGRPVPKQLNNQIYTGSGRRLLHSPVARFWSVTLTTTAKDNEGNIHTMTRGYKPDTAMFLSDLNQAITPFWITDVDKTLGDMDVISAIAVARTRVI